MYVGLTGLLGTTGTAVLGPGTEGTDVLLGMLGTLGVPIFGTLGIGRTVKPGDSVGDDLNEPLKVGRELKLGEKLRLENDGEKLRAAEKLTLRALTGVAVTKAAMTAITVKSLLTIIIFFVLNRRMKIFAHLFAQRLDDFFLHV